MCFRMNCLPSDPRVLIDYKSPSQKLPHYSYCGKVIYRSLFVLGRNSVIRINEENEGLLWTKVAPRVSVSACGPSSNDR